MNRKLITCIVAAAALLAVGAAVDLSSVMVDSSGVVQRPPGFWSAVATNDPAFSNAVNSVSGVSGFLATVTSNNISGHLNFGQIDGVPAYLTIVNSNNLSGHWNWSQIDGVPAYLTAVTSNNISGHLNFSQLDGVPAYLTAVSSNNFTGHLNASQIDGTFTGTFSGDGSGFTNQVPLAGIAAGTLVSSNLAAQIAALAVLPWASGISGIPQLLLNLVGAPPFTNISQVAAVQFPSYNAPTNTGNVQNTNLPIVMGKWTKVAAQRFSLIIPIVLPSNAGAATNSSLWVSNDLTLVKTTGDTKSTPAGGQPQTNTLILPIGDTHTWILVTNGQLAIQTNMLILE